MCGISRAIKEELVVDVRASLWLSSRRRSRRRRRRDFIEPIRRLLLFSSAVTLDGHILSSLLLTRRVIKRRLLCFHRPTRRSFCGHTSPTCVFLPPVYYRIFGSLSQRAIGKRRISVCRLFFCSCRLVPLRYTWTAVIQCQRLIFSHGRHCLLKLYWEEKRARRLLFIGGRPQLLADEVRPRHSSHNLQRGIRVVNTWTPRGVGQQ